MSTTFILKDTPELLSVWMPNSGAFDDILNLIIDELYLCEEKLAKHLNEILVPSFYGNINELNEEQFNTLCQVADQVFESVFAENTNVDKRAFSQLKALLRIDSRNRLRHQANKETAIYFNSDLIWFGPKWLVDLIAEMAVIRLRQENEEVNVSNLLLGWDSQLSSHSLSNVIDYDYCKLLTALKWLTEYFDQPQKGRVAFSSEFSPIVYTKTRELFEVASHDNRARACE